MCVCVCVLVCSFRISARRAFRKTTTSFKRANGLTNQRMRVPGQRCGDGLKVFAWGRGREIEIEKSSENPAAPIKQTQLDANVLQEN